MTEIRLLGICGSLRKASHNMTLLKTAQQLLPTGVSLQIADLTEVPLFNADLSAKPTAVIALLEAMQQADGFVFACPEYNYSIAPALKNALALDPCRRTVTALQLHEAFKGKKGIVQRVVSRFKR